MPYVSSEAGSETHKALVLYCELAIFMSLTVGGFGRWRKRVVLMNKLGASVSSGWAAALIPVIFSQRVEGTGLLAFRVEPRFSVWRLITSLTETRSDELSRVDWYHQACSQGVPSWLPGLRVSPCHCGYSKSCTGRLISGQTTS